jgi:hypothetical protein
MGQEDQIGESLEGGVWYQGLVSSSDPGKFNALLTNGTLYFQYGHWHRQFIQLTSQNKKPIHIARSLLIHTSGVN